MCKVVVIGGGTGLSSVIKGLKNVAGISELSAIVTVSDNGGSTRELRYSYNIPAVGDLRQVVVALSKNESTIEEVFKYRFGDQIPGLNNHSLGNLIMSALIDIEQDFYKGIERLSDIFELEGNLLPITDHSSIELCAKYTDGTEAVGEVNVPNKDKRIDYLFLNEKGIKPNVNAIRAIEEADIIIFGVGSLYTSLISNLIIPGVKEAIIKNSKAKKIYFGNIMTQPGESDNMTMYDHVNAIEKHLEHNIIDYLVIDNSKIPETLLKKYANEGSYPVVIDDNIKASHVKILEYPLVDVLGSTIKHNDKKVFKCFGDILKKEFSR